MRKTILLLAGVAAGLALLAHEYRQRPPARPDQSLPSTGSEKGQVLYWYDPMVPQTHFDHPGKSPFMDMQLVPKYAGPGGAEDVGTVSIDPRALQNLGVRTAKVERGRVSAPIEAMGVVAVDERRVTTVEARASGWVEKLSVNAVGDPVRRGQAVASIYSPDLYAVRSELDLAQKSDDLQLAAAARQRLRLLGATTGHGTETAIIAPATGVVTDLGIREGAQVSPGMALMKLADLSHIWITVQVPEAQSPFLRVGAGAAARAAAMPGRTLHGRVEYVYPTADSSTRTITARVGFDNPDGALRPGQYASVRLDVLASESALSVPTEAVIRTGSGARVIVALGDGRFTPRAVTIADESGDRTVIVAGLNDGETVVSSGQFLIDSEANLQGALSRLAPTPGEAPK